MNNVLTLKGNRFDQKKRPGAMGPITLLKTSKVELAKLQKIHDSLLQVRRFWQDNQLLDGILISVYYDRIVAKSNRLQGYLSGASSSTPNVSIVGAKFNNTKDKHIITHYVSSEVLDKTIKLSEKTIQLFSASFSEGIIDHKDFSNVELFDGLSYQKYGIGKTIFRKFLRDSCFIESFGVEQAEKQNLSNSIVTFFDTNSDIRQLMKKVGIDLSPENILDQTTALLDERNVDLVLSRAPYLVSMAVEDFTRLSPEDFGSQIENQKREIAAPLNEPTIGVIDTLFDENVYFSEWVENHDMVSNEIRKNSDDYKHGTAVTSLIVDGHRLNPRLDDGCGHFKVRHFGVSLSSGFNSFAVIKQIREIVSQNTDIKVWNLSLGATDEIRDNFISAEAATIDQIQFENDVIFVIAGTNNTPGDTRRRKIGSPADSLNAVIVNSVDFDQKPANYGRHGIVLSFFLKPDISYYGGGNGQFLTAYDSSGITKVSGTSYAAPLIARKLAYLIHVIGLNREEAKALLVDSAIGWNNKMTFEEKTLIGNGVVPIKLEDIVTTKDDEIKFIVSDISLKYDTFNYDFPVPISKGKYPYVAKATMCYFPKCSRNQGVDYTNSELNLTFGRLKPTGIDPINHDNQNMEDAPGYIKEDSARAVFRKWDNVKHIAETFTSRKKAKPIKNPVNPQWGMSVKTIERLKAGDGEGIRFGVVVTLKEINGVNRIDDFINQALLRGWMVDRIQVDTQVDLYNKLTEEIEFD